jgi:hypothetical protein
MNIPLENKENKVPEEGAKGKTPSKLYTLDVYLIGGPVSDELVLRSTLTRMMNKEAFSSH